MLKRLIAIGVMGLLMVPAAFAEEPRVGFPADYRSKMVNYLSLDRVGNDDQIIRLYTTPEALAAAKAGKELPDGTVVIGEVYKAQKDAEGNVKESGLGRRLRSKFAAVAVMEKGKDWGQTIPEDLRTGDWDFAIFKPTGERLAKKDLNECRACHIPKKETQYLFSLDHMAAAAE